MFNLNKMTRFPNIFLPRSNSFIYFCLFANIEIKIFEWHIQKSGVVQNIGCCQHR